MVAANGTMVAYLERAGLPMLQRVVRVPRYWDRIVATAALYGETLPEDPDAKALAAFLLRRRAADPDRFPDLSLTVIKLLGPGEYVALAPGEESDGHFSLAVTDYTHATAPNRRYPDLVNQRLVAAVLEGTPVPYDGKELGDLATWLSDREKGTKKVERFVHKAAAAVLLRDRVGETFDGLVTGASEKGTWVRIIAPPVEGRVMRGEEGLAVGDRVRVRLLGDRPVPGLHRLRERERAGPRLSPRTHRGGAPPSLVSGQVSRPPASPSSGISQPIRRQPRRVWSSTISSRERRFGASFRIASTYSVSSWSSR